MKFSQKLKAIREERGLNQVELASLLNTSKQAISRYEKGDVSPTLKKAVEFASVLGFDVLNLVDDSIDYRNGEFVASSPAPSVSQIKRELIEAIDGLTDEQCEHLKALVDMVKR